MVAGGGIVSKYEPPDPNDEIDALLAEMARAMAEVDGHQTSDWIMLKEPIPDPEPQFWGIMKNYVHAARKHLAADRAMRRGRRGG